MEVLSYILYFLIGVAVICAYIGFSFHYFFYAVPLVVFYILSLLVGPGPKVFVFIFSTLLIAHSLKLINSIWQTFVASFIGVLLWVIWYSFIQ